MKLKVTNFNALHVFCCYIMIDLLLYLGTNIFGPVCLAIRHVCPWDLHTQYEQNKPKWRLQILHWSFLHLVIIHSKVC